MLWRYVAQATKAHAAVHPGAGRRPWLVGAVGTVAVVVVDALGRKLRL